VDVHGPHVSLFWKPFGKFIDSVSGTAPPDPRYLQIASTLMSKMSAVFDGSSGEKDHQQELRDCILPIGDFERVSLQHLHGSQTDLTLVFNNRPGINIELKTELGKGGNNPIEQNAFYYVHLTSDNDDCLDPMFLISIAGCNFLQVFGAIHGEHDEVLLDPLCDPVSLLHVPDDLLQGEVEVAHVLEAIAGAKSELAEYYAEPHSGVQPYYNCDGNLQYIKSINRNVWEAKLTKDGVTESVIVKFTTQYSSDVHKCLYEYGWLQN